MTKDDRVSCLSSTLHDPEARLLSLIRRLTGSLPAIFNPITVRISPETDRKVLDELREQGVKASYGSKNVVDTYKGALIDALKEGSGHIFYCDYDRVLHWFNKYPDELAQINKATRNHDFTLIGRTERAFRTHPQTQRKTEYIANLVGSKILRFEETRDIIGACWNLSTQLAETLVRVSSDSTYGFYCEWPTIAWQSARSPGYLEVEGLEWETPDRFQKEIGKIGYDEWLAKFQTQAEWERRIKVMEDSISSLLKYIGS